MPAAGYRSTVLKHVGGMSAPAVSSVAAGWRSPLLRHVGGLSAPSGVVVPAGWRSPLLRWVGGMCAPRVAPPTPTPENIGSYPGTRRRDEDWRYLRKKRLLQDEQDLIEIMASVIPYLK